VSIRLFFCNIFLLEQGRRTDHADEEEEERRSSCRDRSVCVRVIDGRLSEFPTLNRENDGIDDLSFFFISVCVLRFLLLHHHHHLLLLVFV